MRCIYKLSIDGYVEYGIDETLATVANARCPKSSDSAANVTLDVQRLAVCSSAIVSRETLIFQMKRKQTQKKTLVYEGMIAYDIVIDYECLDTRNATCVAHFLDMCVVVVDALTPATIHFL